VRAGQFHRDSRTFFDPLANGRSMIPWHRASLTRATML
jgi:hypothetical protein